MAKLSLRLCLRYIVEDDPIARKATKAVLNGFYASDALAERVAAAEDRPDWLDGYLSGSSTGF